MMKNVITYWTSAVDWRLKYVVLWSRCFSDCCNWCHWFAGGSKSGVFTLGCLLRGRRLDALLKCTTRPHPAAGQLTACASPTCPFPVLLTFYVDREKHLQHVLFRFAKAPEEVSGNLEWKLKWQQNFSLSSFSLQSLWVYYICYWTLIPVFPCQVFPLNIGGNSYTGLISFVFMSWIKKET